MAYEDDEPTVVVVEDAPHGGPRSDRSHQSGGRADEGEDPDLLDSIRARGGFVRGSSSHLAGG